MVSNDQLSQDEYRVLKLMLERYFSDTNLIDISEQEKFNQLIEKAAKIKGQCPKVFLKEQKIIFQRASEAAYAGNFEH